MAMIIMSVWFIARILPNKYELMSILLPGERAFTAVPIARADVDRMAMAASPFMCLLLLILRIRKDAISTIGMAKYKGVKPSDSAITVAPKATCDRPSPIID